MKNPGSGCVISFLEQSIEEFSTSLRGFDLDFRQLDSGFFNASTVTIDLDGVHIKRRRNSLRYALKGRLPPGVIFYFPLVPLDLFINGCCIDPGIQLVSTGARDMFSIAPGCYDHLLVRLEPDELRRHLGEAGAAEFVALANRIDHSPVDSAIKQDMTLHLSALYRDLLERDAVVDRQEQQRLRRDVVLALDAYLRRLRPAPRKQACNRERLLYRVLQLLERDSARCWNLDQITAECFASKRAIQYAFELLLGMSPMRYAKLHRLNIIRRELRGRGSGVNLAGLASSFGFSNPGRLTREYTELFGESPRDTARRGTAQWPVAAGNGIDERTPA